MTIKLNAMDAFAVTDDDGNYVLDSGYLSFVCEGNGNIIRVDPEQFHFEGGTEPYVMEVEDVKYNLYFTKKNGVSESHDKQDHEYCFLGKYVSVNESKDIQSTANRFPLRPKWDNESTKFLKELYKQICPHIGSTLKFRTKKRVWQKISEEFKSRGYSFSPYQVESKWKSLMRTHKNTANTQKSKTVVPAKPTSSLGIRGSQFNRQLVDIIQEKGSMLNLLIDNSPDHCPKKEMLLKSLAQADIQELLEDINIKPVPQRNEQQNKLNSNLLLSSRPGKGTWTRTNTEILINLHKEFIGQLGTPKCHNEQRLWAKICLELSLRGHHFTLEQVEKRWKSLESFITSKKQESEKEGRRFQEVLTNNNTVKLKEDLDIAMELQTALSTEGGVEVHMSGVKSELQPLKKFRPILAKPGITSKCSKWTVGSTELLTELYDEISPLQGRNRQYPTRQAMFEKISEELRHRGNYTFTPDQVENKWKSLQKQLCNRMQKIMGKETKVLLPSEKNMDNSSGDEQAMKYLLQLTSDNDDNNIVIEESLLETDTPALSEDSQFKDENHAFAITKREWDKEQTQLLIDFYKKCRPLQGSDKGMHKYRTKKQMWQAISTQMLARGHLFTAEQVENRWKSMERSLRNKFMKNKKLSFEDTPMENGEVYSHNLQHDSSEVVSNVINMMDIEPTDQEDSTCAMSTPDFKNYHKIIERALDHGRVRKQHRKHSRPVTSKTLAVTECLKRLTEAKEVYYERKIELQEKKLKAFEERTAEIQKTNELLAMLIQNNNSS